MFCTGTIAIQAAAAAVKRHFFCGSLSRNYILDQYADGRSEAAGLLLGPGRKLAVLAAFDRPNLCVHSQLLFLLARELLLRRTCSKHQPLACVW